MNKDIENKMAHLCESLSVRLVLVEFLKSKLEERQSAFMQCVPATFETQKGRCLELQDLIKHIEGRK